jgi:hypothetical protein
MKTAAELDKAIKAVCPIIGVSIGKKGDKATWAIDFDSSATQAQKNAAQVVLDAFVWDDTPADISDPTNHGKVILALGLVVAAWNGKTVPQLKAAFKTAWDSLP